MTTTTPRKRKFFSFSRVQAIAWNTLTELVRLKVFYFLLLFALVIIGSSLFMIQFTFQQEFQVLKDASLGAMTIFTSLLAILATANLLPKDIEDRTLYTILAKPVPRFEYLVGKLLGVFLLLLISVICMSLVFVVVLWLRQTTVLAQVQAEFARSPEDLVVKVREVRAAGLTPAIFEGVTLIYIKACLLASLTLLISTFASSAIFSTIVAVVVYFIGHLQSTAREYWLADRNVTWLTRVFTALVSLIFPDLQLFNLVDDIVAGNPVATALFLKTCGLGCLYILFYTLAAQFIFVKKEL
ncbi:MAG: ABC transporter permease subunit [Chthoniobacterales bacterium]